MLSAMRKASLVSTMAYLSVLTLIFGLSSLVIIQSRTITLLQSCCDVYTLTPIAQRPQLRVQQAAHPDLLPAKSAESTNITKKLQPSELQSVGSTSQSRRVIRGTAFTLFLGSPKWFQNRYSMMINMLLGALPKDWIVQIFYLPKNKMSSEAVNHAGILKQVRKGNVELVAIPSIYSKMKKRDLMVLPWVWEQLKSENVLTFGGTNVLCSNSPLDLEDDFEGFAFVGSPSDSLKGIGGDGGLSLRNRTAILEILTGSANAKALKKTDGEDTFFIRNMMKLRKSGAAEYNIGRREDTVAFALNDGSQSFNVDWNPEFAHTMKPGDLPLGAQGTLSGLDDAERSKALEYCPELKMFFPSLHSTACFGASPRPLECFKFLCEQGGLRCDEDAIVDGGLEFFVNKKKSNTTGKLVIQMMD